VTGASGETGAVNETVTCPSPAVALTSGGAPGSPPHPWFAEAHVENAIKAAAKDRAAFA
jgi:hypothetical protein